MGEDQDPIERGADLSIMEDEKLKAAVLERLSAVIDPETGVDVVHMRLIEDLTVSEAGFVRYKFRPSSPLCPIALPLSIEISKAVAETPGVSAQEFEIVGYLQSDALNQLLKELMDEMSG